MKSGFSSATAHAYSSFFCKVFFSYFCSIFKSLFNAWYSSSNREEPLKVQPLQSRSTSKVGSVNWEEEEVFLLLLPYCERLVVWHKKSGPGKYTGIENHARGNKVPGRYHKVTRHRLAARVEETVERTEWGPPHQQRWLCPTFAQFLRQDGRPG